MGRKKRGNVLFARRVHPSKVPELLEVLKKDRVSSAVSLERPDSPSDARPAINQPPDKHAHEVMQLLSDINSREAEKVDLLDRISSLEAGITDEVVVRLRAENRQLKEVIKKYEQERYG